MSTGKNIFVDEFNDYFKENGAWEKGGGRRQTELFSHYFDQVVSLPEGKFSLLDVGCALGEAAAFFADRYPDAQVSATDISDVAIQRAKAQYGDKVHFFREDLGRIQGKYDVIYCSNVLEHFYDFKDKTRHLATCCDRLCIMVPFNQRQRGRKLVLDKNSFEHQHSFYEDSFDFLLHEGLAGTINRAFHPCPIAWGWNRRQRITHGIDNLFRRITGRPVESEPMQIIFDILTREESPSLG